MENEFGNLFQFKLKKHATGEILYKGKQLLLHGFFFSDKRSISIMRYIYIIMTIITNAIIICLLQKNRKHMYNRLVIIQCKYFIVDEKLATFLFEL